MSSPAFAPEQPISPVAVVEALRGQLLDLMDVLWAARLPEEMLDAVTGLEKLRSVLDAVELSVVHEIHATGAAKTEGWSTTKQFVEAVSGRHRGAGKATVMLADAVTGDLTRVGEELANGAISRTQAEVIVRAIKKLPVKRSVRDEAAEAMLEAARELPTTDLKVMGKHLITVLDPDGSEREEEKNLDRHERAAHLSRYLTITDDGAGGVRIKGRTTVEDAAIIKAALSPLAGPRTTDPGACGGPGACPETTCGHDGRDPRDHGARFLDALVEGCRRLLSAKVLPTAHGTTPRLSLTMDYHQLAAGIGTGTLDTGESLSASAVRRLACDCDVLPLVLGGRGEILDVGRTQRLVTLAIWVALVVRDKHCAFPGCTAPPIACDAHHILHWLAGGPTSLDNLCLLCRAHHTIIHNSPWEVRLNPADRRPEFLAPARLYPEGRPIRRRTPRLE